MIAAASLGGLSHAMAAMAVGATALLLAFLSLSRPAARLARWPLASALLAGGWIALTVVEPEDGRLWDRDVERGWVPATDDQAAPAPVG